MTIWLFLFLFLIHYLSCVQCNADLFQNNTALEQMTNKICQIARDKLHIQHATPENKMRLLEFMKNKLKTTALALGQDGLHVQLIIQGIAILSDDINYQEICKGKKNLRRMLDNHVTDYALDEGLGMISLRELKTIGIMKKMEAVIERAMRNASSLEEKQQNVEKVKKRLIDLYLREQQLKNSVENGVKDGNETKEFINLLRNSIDATMEKLLLRKTRRKLNVVTSSTSNPNKIDNNSLKSQYVKELLMSSTTARSERNVETTTSFLSRQYSGATVMRNICEDAVKEACSQLKEMDQSKCQDDGTTVKAQFVCDGVADCNDGSDERNCIQQVVRKVQRATQVMSQIELQRNCFNTLLEDSVISRQGALLMELLNSQIEFLKRYTQNPNKVKDIAASVPPASERGPRKNVYHPDPTVDEVVSEVALVLRTFGVTLTSALCRRDSDEVQKANKMQEIDNLEIETEEKKPDQPWSPESCDCLGSYCRNMSFCQPNCRIYCYHTYTLNRFKCKAVTQGQDSIPVDYVCDGKVDCFEEIDEISCSEESAMAKFEGNKYYDKVMNMLKEKFLARGYEIVRPMLVELQVQIQKIQMYGLSPKISLAAFRRLRDEYFKKITSIYDTQIETSVNGDAGEEVFNFLTDLNGKLVEALKRTHTGNLKVISNDNCYCREAECASLECTPRCKRTCIVKNSMTNFICSEAKGSNVTSVPIDTICNGNINCPNADDELHCIPEICRTHHAKVLRINIQNVGLKYKGTLMGDALDSWKKKVLPSLLILERRERVSPRLMQNAVYQIVNDLSLAFMSLEKHRRLETEPILKKFIKLSQKLIESLKTCTK